MKPVRKDLATAMEDVIGKQLTNDKQIVAVLSAIEAGARTSHEPGELLVRRGLPD